VSELEQLQAAIIQLHALNEEHTRVAARLAKLKTDRRLMELAAMQIMRGLGLESLGHAGIHAKIKHTTHYSPIPGDGWQRIYARIARTGEWELLQKRLSSTAVRERFNLGDAIDGVQAVPVPELDLTLQGGNPS
jgi:hypothetical protein